MPAQHLVRQHPEHRPPHQSSQTSPRRRSANSVQMVAPGRAAPVPVALFASPRIPRAWGPSCRASAALIVIGPPGGRCSRGAAPPRGGRPRRPSDCRSRFLWLFSRRRRAAAASVPPRPRRWCTGYHQTWASGAGRPGGQASGPGGRALRGAARPRPPPPRRPPPSPARGPRGCRPPPWRCPFPAPARRGAARPPRRHERPPPQPLAAPRRAACRPRHRRPSPPRRALVQQRRLPSPRASRPRRRPCHHMT
mmetsp:Transcript_17226/g.49150  ORF Transcript_17226/g.49150 Transcript_17226/m.49150 type:complete len:251 (-) Transcript_17226:3424-4176(-)